MKPEILMLVNEFPPTGESGVQRPLKFLKYLDRAGWKTHVVTPAKPTKTVLDHSLCEEIPKSARIYKTGSLGFGGRTVDRVAELRFSGRQNKFRLRSLLSKSLQLINHVVFPIDKQIGWIPFAYLKACQIIRLHNIRNVYITAYPYSAFLAGILLKRRFKDKIFWVADYRDAWQFEPLMAEKLPAFRMKIIRKLDERVLKTCDVALFTTEAVRRTYIQHYPWLEGKSSTITNGYDEDDFKDLKPRFFEKFTILFMGKLYNPTRPNVIPVLEVIRKLDWAEFQYIHIGSISPEVEDLIRERGYDFYDYQGYKDHKVALEHVLGADIVLLMINEDKYSREFFPGKLFELLRSGRPLLTVGPQSSIVKDVIEESGVGEYVYAGDLDGIIAALNRLRGNPRKYVPKWDVVSRFDRERLCRQLIGLYD
ncbi:MAG: glycosyltransferase [Candidatus Syntrophosphaera sp.]